MSDSERLHDKIARLGDDIGVTGTGWRVLSASDPEALTGLLLREIEETILTRCLVVDSGSGAPARINVAAGRILGLETPESAVSGGDGYDDPADFAVALALALRAYVGGQTTLRIRSERASLASGPGDTRCSVAQIAGLLRPAATGGTGLRAFAELMSAHALAWRLSGDGGAGGDDGDGPQDRVAALARFMQDRRAEIDAQLDLVLGGGGRAGCILFSAGNTGDSRLVLARAEGAYLAMLLHAAAESEIATRWNAVFAG
ncbi:MAG: hypothetical protein ACK5MY_17220 [Jhaorihella sp.]